MFSSVLLRRAALAAQRSSTRDLSRALLHRNGAAIGSTTTLTCAQRGAIVTMLRAYATSGRTGTKATTRKATTTKRTTKKTATKKKTTKKAPKKKAAKKAAPKKRKVLTEKQKEAKAKRDLLSKRRELREKALLTQKLDLLPETAYMLFVQQQLSGYKGEASSVLRETAAKYRSLGVPERESLNHQANQNKEANKVTYKRWVNSYTPLQIHEANLARKQLHRLSRSETTGRKPRKLAAIPDERAPLRPRSPNIFFARERLNSGDFAGIPAAEAMRRVTQEYKQLSQSEKQKYVDLTQQDRGRYAREVKQAYGRDAPSAKKT